MWKRPVEVFWHICINIPDIKVHEANTGPIWGRQDPDGPHVSPVNFAIWVKMGEWFRLHRKWRNDYDMNDPKDLPPSLCPFVSLILFPSLILSIALRMFSIPLSFCHLSLPIPHKLDLDYTCINPTQKFLGSFPIPIFLHCMMTQWFRTIKWVTIMTPHGRHGVSNHW